MRRTRNRQSNNSNKLLTKILITRKQIITGIIIIANMRANTKISLEVKENYGCYNSRDQDCGRHGPEDKVDTKVNITIKIIKVIIIIPLPISRTFNSC